MTSRAPPGICSSAGWNTSRTRPGRSRPARARPTPSTTAVCTSWPQAWQTPSTCER